ncbi:unnamed protein product [Caenorhabditis nigoni]
MATPGSAIAKYLFRCSTHLRSNRKVNATLTMLNDLETPLTLIRLYDIKELVENYRDDKEHKKLANMVLLKIRAMRMEEKRQDASRKTFEPKTSGEFKIPRIPTHRIQKRTIIAK